jgi:glycerophosphoryl diester phosphodiesterase
LTNSAILLLAVVAMAPHQLPAITAGSLKGYIREVPSESSAEREARHRKIAERRAGPIIMVHRGASAFAPENTLEAYAAAIDYGADGCEMDLRRTADGVLVLFHDDMLDHLTDGFGSVNQLTYYELLSLTPRFRYGAATRQTRPPTFAAVLALARQRAMLLHLDVKEPNLEDEIARLLDAADAWDHVVAVNSANAPKLLQNSKSKLLKYKVPGLYEERRDVDPDAVKVALAAPGEMIMVDDPRVAAHELKRAPCQPLPLPRGLRVDWPPTVAVFAPEQKTFVPHLYIRSRLKTVRPDSVKDLMQLLTTNDAAARAQPDGDATYQRRRTERIIERACAAQQIGKLGRKSAQVIQVLEFQVQHRSLHRDWMYHGLDGAMAARALGMLRATESVPVLIETFRRIDPEVKKIANPEFAQYPLSWTDWRPKMYTFAALGELRCAASKNFLKEYLTMDEAQAREFSPPQFEEAAKALLRHDLSGDELKWLLRSPHSAVRGTAILECIDHPRVERTAALREVAPWSLDLPAGYK